MFGHGGSRHGAGRKAKYTAREVMDIGIRVAEQMKTMQTADKARQIEADPRTAVVRAAQRRVESIAERFFSRVAALRYVRWGPSKQLDQIGRVSGYAPRTNFQAEAIAAVACEMHLPPRVVRKVYREYRQRFPEPEQVYTPFDLFPPSEWKPPRKESGFQWHAKEEADLYRREWRDPPDPEIDPDFAGSIRKREAADNNRRRRR